MGLLTSRCSCSPAGTWHWNRARFQRAGGSVAWGRTPHSSRSCTARDAAAPRRTMPTPCLDPAPWSNRSFVGVSFLPHSLPSFGCYFLTSTPPTTTFPLLPAADAIRKNITELKDESRGISPATDYIILSGSGVYNIDFTQVGGARSDCRGLVQGAGGWVGSSGAPVHGVPEVHSTAVDVNGLHRWGRQQGAGQARAGTTCLGAGLEQLGCVGCRGAARGCGWHPP